MYTLAEKNETSRKNARAALDAYRATGRQDSDDGAAIGDLITDLLILFSEREERNGETERTETMLDRAVRDWEYETNPENADEQC